MEAVRDLSDFIAFGFIFAMFMGLLFSCLKGSSLVESAIYIVGTIGLITLITVDSQLPSNPLKVVARAIAIFSTAIVLARIYTHQADEFIGIVKYLGNHSGESILAILAGLLTWSFCAPLLPSKKIQPMIVAGTSVAGHKPTKLYSKVGPWSKLSEWDAQFVAAHEAGHAVALGLFPYIEKGCHVVLQMGVDADFLDGYCQVNGWRQKSQSMSYLEIDMIILLAGVEAEKLCMGERGISATSDHERFIEQARKHLQCDDKSLYFYRPANEHEVRHNTDSIMSLKLKYQNITRNLLAENREILDVIRAALVEKGVVKGAELQGLLSRVKWVPGCPIISPALNAALKADVEASDSLYKERPIA